MGLDIYFYKTRKNDNLSTTEDYYKQSAQDREDEIKSLLADFTEKINNATEETYPDVYREIFDFFAKRFEGEEYLLDDEMQSELHPKEDTLKWLNERGAWILEYNKECAYFRKVNFIYAFFSEKLENESCFVTKAELTDLYERCFKIMSTNGAYYDAKKHLEEVNGNIEEMSNTIVALAKEKKDTTDYDEELNKLVEDKEQTQTTIDFLEDKLIDVEEILPTQSGFFFGSTAYDEWYYYDVKYAEKIFGKLLKEFDEDNEVMFVDMSW